MDIRVQKIDIIANRYKGYYVYIDNCKIGEYGNVIEGRVVLYEKDKELFYKKVREIETGTITYILPLVDQVKWFNIFL